MLNDMMQQLPGLVFWKNNQSSYVGCNINLAKFLGLGSCHAIIEKQDTQLPWSSHAEQYVQYDQYLLETQSTISVLQTVLDVKERAYLALTQKKWLDDSQVILGQTKIISKQNAVTHLQQLGLDINEVFTSAITEHYRIETKLLNLSPRESVCLFYLARGYTSKAIAKLMGISPRTVESHIHNIKERLNLHTKSQLVNCYYEQGLDHILLASMLEALG